MTISTPLHTWFLYFGLLAIPGISEGMYETGIKDTAGRFKAFKLYLSKR